MIPQRFTHLLRNTETAYDILGGCKICDSTERGTIRLPAPEHETHLAYHRRETVTREPRRTDFLEECE